MAIRGVFNSSGKQHVLVHPFYYEQRWAYVHFSYLSRSCTRVFLLKNRSLYYVCPNNALQFFAARELLPIQVGFQTWKETDVTLEHIVKNLTARCFDF